MGVYTSVNGRISLAEYKNNLRNGIGETIIQNHSYELCSYINGKEHGLAKEYHFYNQNWYYTLYENGYKIMQFSN